MTGFSSTIRIKIKIGVRMESGSDARFFGQISSLSGPATKGKTVVNTALYLLADTVLG